MNQLNDVSDVTDLAFISFGHRIYHLAIGQKTGGKKYEMFYFLYVASQISRYPSGC
jgi:hypothetical protein